jgi:DNA-binding MarR family transcriptional regulator
MPLWNPPTSPSGSASRGETTTHTRQAAQATCRLGIDQAGLAVTSEAQRLERLGLVTRTRCVEDARVCRLRLSAEGQEAISRFLLARHQWLVTLLADWSPEDQRDFARLIGRFASDIHRHLDEIHV